MNQNDMEFFLNSENQIQLVMSKESYTKLDDNAGNFIKSYFYFSRYDKFWKSKRRGNLDYLSQQLKKYGFVESKQKQELLLTDEEIKQSKIDRYKQIIESKKQKIKSLESEYLHYKGDISFFTQPIIRGHKGSESFGKYRDRVFNKYRQSLEERTKLEYYENKLAELEIPKLEIVNEEYFENHIDDISKIVFNIRGGKIQSIEGNPNYVTKFKGVYKNPKQLQNFINTYDVISYSENGEFGYNKVNLILDIDRKYYFGEQKVFIDNNTPFELRIDCADGVRHGQDQIDIKSNVKELLKYKNAEEKIITFADDKDLDDSNNNDKDLSL